MNPLPSSPPAADRRPPEGKVPRRVYREAFACVRPYRGPAVLVGLVLVLSTILNLLPPLLVRGLIDHGIPAGQAAASALPLLPYLLGLVLLPGAASLLTLAQQYLATRIGLRVLADLRDRLFRHWQAQPLGFFTSTPAGELGARMGEDVTRVGTAVAEVLPTALGLAVMLAGTLAVLFVLSWPLALAACAVLPAFLLPVRRAGKRRRALAARIQELSAGLLGMMQDVLNAGGFLVMYLFDRGTAEAGRFAALGAEQNRLHSRLVLTARWTEVALALCAAFGSAVVYSYGGWLVVRGEVSLGTVVAFVGYLAALYGPLSRLADVHGYLQETLGVLQRIFAVLDQAPAVRDRPGARALPPVRGELCFEHVTFAYAPGRRPALHDVSFAVRPGQLAALVGPSGAGKTTAVSLVPRFYDPQQGCVRVDGTDVRDVTRRSLVAQIGLIPQEAYLFHTSVRANLLYARPEAGPAELEAACRAAQVHDVVARLPDGYDTVVGEHGAKLSGGERQRLALARVLLKDPRLLILDEATSSLDSEAERLLREALAPLRRGRTTLVIAHRLSTILTADVILVLDGGRLVERGTHEELLRAGGLYARLYQQQFRAQSPGELGRHD